MNEEMTEERERVLRLFGAELELTPPERHTLAAKERALELNKKISNSFYINQHDNPANLKSHMETTAEEIWKDTEGKIDIFVAALGTTGTACGVAATLKLRKQGLQIVGVVPSSAPMLSKGDWAVDKMPGTSPGFMPGLSEKELLDEILLVEPESEAYPMCRRLAKEEGILVGVTSGATAAAAIRLGKRTQNKGKAEIFFHTGSFLI